LHLWNTHYADVAKQGFVKHAVMRFSVSGYSELSKALPWLGEIMEELIDFYYHMQRLNAWIDEYLAMSGAGRNEQQRKLSSLLEEIRGLVEDDKFKNSLERIKNHLERLAQEELPV